MSYVPPMSFVVNSVAAKAVLGHNGRPLQSQVITMARKKLITRIIHLAYSRTGRFVNNPG
jgi:hypothetical protein